MYLEWSALTGSDVVGVRMWPGERAIVVLNSYAAIRDAFAGSESAEALSGRPHSAFWKLSNPFARGIHPVASHFTVVVPVLDESF